MGENIGLYGIDENVVMILIGLKSKIMTWNGNIAGGKIIKIPFASNNDNESRYQPSGAKGTRSPPAMPHRLQNPRWGSILQNQKWPPGAPKMADGVCKGV